MVPSPWCINEASKPIGKQEWRTVAALRRLCEVEMDPVLSTVAFQPIFLLLRLGSFSVPGKWIATRVPLFKDAALQFY